MNKNSKYIYTQDDDLTQNQIEETVRTYLKFAKNYSEQIERVEDAKERIQSHTLFPFLEEYQKSNLKLPILFIGCGSGRDIQTAENLGFACVGIDISPEMIQLAKSNGVTSPLHIMDMRDLNFVPNSFGAVFCETAISHINKTDQQKVLRNFERILTKNGIIFLGVRLGSGKVFYTTDDVGGMRFNTTTSLEDSLSMIHKADLQVISQTQKEVLDRPTMINYIISKP